jgi:hypothetical protein
LYKTVKDILAIIGALVVAWYVFNWLIAAGILHIITPGQ